MGTLDELVTALPELMLRDQRRLRRRIEAARKTRDVAGGDATVADLAAEVEAARVRVARRAAGVPKLSYPEALPISQRRDEILAAIRDHQVVIVAGETGSGKTTQIPKICLELGRGVRGLIGHTQPRRLAARTVAERIAEELGTPLGAAVGYQVRFTGQVGDDTLVKLMTDGILLAETQRDRQLLRYDTLIVDEAHERSLNVDFLLGYLKQLLPRRPDLKVVITSATIDPERFSRHFGGAPVVEVSGRVYPVEVRYRPIEPEDKDRDQTQAICDAVVELDARAPGDILVFLSGEREIRDTADALRRMSLRHTEVLPLYARLSVAEQHRVFAAHPGRRIVLATNVAETSLTVPGIRYVIDPGTARISRYSQRLKVQRLPIEAVSQASANQRKGRCGRTSDGICIRLYDEADFVARPEFTEPEILRTNLASVILQMVALDLGDIAAFPFIDPPDRRNIADGIQLLQELGALDAAGKLTPIGRKLAGLPIDPRLGRMILAAQRTGCVPEVLVIAAALSIQDPRERPLDQQPAADAKHARFTDKDSDFAGLLNLWNHLREQQRALSSSQFRRLCRTDFLNYLRVREWQDLVSQLRQLVGGPASGTPAESEAVHRALLAGLLSHIGLYEPEKREYAGARNARFAIFPGSALFKKQPRWVMAAELVETSRLWARIVARIEPEWAEELAEHLVKRSYSEPHWEKKQGAVLAYEKVTLYGLPIVVQRKVNYGRIDPRLSRELFIRHALVAGDWDTHHEFFHANRALLDEVEELEHRVRRRDILVDDETLVDFYDRRVGADVVSARHFDSWWKRVRRTDPELLNFEKSMLINDAASAVSAVDYPDSWTQGALSLPLTYQFEPGTGADGVTVHIPLELLGMVAEAGFDWQVPGLRTELATALVRGLPKPLRRNFVPVPDHVTAALGALTPSDRELSLVDALARRLRELTGVHVPRDAWSAQAVPEHLRITFRVEDETGGTLAEGKDLAELKTRLRPRVQETITAAAPGVAREGLRTWSIGVLPQTLGQPRAGHPVTVYPALVDTGDSVAVRILSTETEQRQAMWAGTRRLLLLNLPAPARIVAGRLSAQATLALSRNPHRSAVDLLDDCAGCAVDKLMAGYGGPPWDESGFARLREQVRTEFVDTVLDTLATVQPILAAAYDVQQRLDELDGAAFAESVADVRAQLAGLVYRGFITGTGWRRLPDLVRYLRAIVRRLEKLPANPQRDRQQTQRVHEVEESYRELRAELPAERSAGADLYEIRWMIEELRVNYFAQALGTAYPVSEERIFRAMDRVAA
ncbi:MAG TPA: ATP-dependent RNA helicase HrpA [Micromonosporaceae bacterium]|jgi:ATP-dependent helicase HrpA|nr:ATP-dependent RNA helicase HrpA [Micromonosporaceae bacterium]